MAADANTTPERATCWIDKDILRRVKQIAAAKGSTISEVLERNLRPAVDREYRLVLRSEMPPELGGEG